ncbi:DUF5691 domain-containing protein [Falsiroseomonas sp. HW251]|uniref:DUF5691 domain-containing protein n=1 Tax=Falsiroseomonas sp. HW251 TaxID=3390998 RepID=UPI003D31FCA2
MREIEAALGALRAAWMAGRPAAEAAPPEWRDVAGPGAGGELALAAIAGQALEVAFRLRPGSPLEDRPPLPRLGLPAPPNDAREIARRLMASLRDEAEKARLIGLMLARGRVMHPADWMPASGDDWLPDAYGPWLDWLRGEAASGASALTEASWAAWPWRACRAELRRLRRADPAAARTLIAARAPSEPADRRVQILELLAELLEEEDAPLLAAFANDRSPRAKQLARGLLARLGPGSDEATRAAEQELAGFFTLRRVLLIQRLEVNPLTGAAARARRAALAQEVGFPGLAAALGLSEHRLLALLPPREDEAGALLQAMAAETGSAALLPALRDRALAGALHDTALASLAARLGREERLRLVAERLRRDADPQFRLPLRLAAGDPGALTLKQVEGPGLAALLATVPTPAEEQPLARQARERLLAAGLLALGMLADAPAAAALIERFVAGGLSIAEPRLDALRLNAMLIPGHTP